MSNPEENLLDALEGLLGERRRYESWIAQLEARRAESPSHVVDRVRDDYQSRLDGVTQVLRGRTSDLEASSATLRERISHIEQEESRRRDERAETELRALVGEFPEEQARESMATSDEALARLAEERGGHSAELARVTEILSLVRPEPPPAPPSAPPPERRADEVSQPERGDNGHVAGAVVADGPSQEASPVASAGESAPREVAVDHAAELAASAETQVASPAPSALQPVSSPLDDELAFLQSVVDTRDESIHAPARESSHVEGRGPDGGDLLPPPVLSAPRRGPTPQGSPSVAPREGFGNSANRGPSLTPGSIPSFLKDMPTEQVKTLKCQECGTMNYPTEWYCERCGGELAAM